MSNTLDEDRAGLQDRDVYGLCNEHVGLSGWSMVEVVLSRNSRLECRFLASPLELQHHRSTAIGIVRKKRGCKEAC